MAETKADSTQMPLKQHSEVITISNTRSRISNDNVLNIKRESSISSLDEALNNSRGDINDRIAMCRDYKPAFRGSLEMILGPMFAGKSTELLRRMQRHEISGKKCLYVKYTGDQRYDVASIATHDQIKQNAVAVSAMSELGDIWKQYDCIGIDEGQFYKDIVAFSEKAASSGKIVIMSALSGTAFRKPFNDVLDLVPKCEKVKQLHAICKVCFAQASYSLRTTADESIELIGHSDIYMPVCRECFIFKTMQQKRREQALANRNLMDNVHFHADDQKETAEKTQTVCVALNENQGTPEGKDSAQRQDQNELSSIEKSGSSCNDGNDESSQQINEKENSSFSTPESSQD